MGLLRAADQFCVDCAGILHLAFKQHRLGWSILQATQSHVPVAVLARSWHLKQRRTHDHA